MPPKTRGGCVQQVRRSRRYQGLEAEPEVIDKVKTKKPRLKKSKEGAEEEGTKVSKDVIQKEVPEIEVQDDNHEKDVHGDEVAVGKDVADEVPEIEIEEDEALPHSKEAETGMPEEHFQPTEGKNGNGEEHSQPKEPEIANPEEPRQPTEDDMEGGNGISGAVTEEAEGNQKKKRGPTKMRKVAKDPQEKVSVSFTELGEHVGPGSVTLSSFLGPLVREHVTVLLDDWRNLDKQTKDTLWEEIQSRFDLKEEWQKDSVFKQMGCLWRAGKSRLVSQLRDAKNNAERVALKPSNIRSVHDWSSWVKSRTSPVFKAKSERYRALRKAQIPHTTSRRGMNRLACELKKKSADPKKITRSKVWIAGHTHADGRPVKPEFAETIDKIISLDSQMDSTSSVNVKEDAVSQVLGVDKPGRVRGLGRGITATKLAFLSARDSKLADMEIEIKSLKNMVRDLAEMKKKNNDSGSPSESISEYKEGTRVQILDWCESEDVVVAEGDFCSVEPTYKIGRIPIGPNAAAVVVKMVSNPNASVWRPTTDVRNLQEAVGCKIPWPMDKLILDSELKDPVSSDVLGSKHTTVDDLERCKIYDWVKGVEVIAEGFKGSTDPHELVNYVPLGPNAVVVKIDKVIDGKAFLWRPTTDFTTMSDAVNEKIAWPLHNVSVMKASEVQGEAIGRRTSLSPSASTSSSSGLRKKCILLELNNSGRKVAEGRVSCTDPLTLVHHVPLGPNASRVWVEVALIEDADLWRPNSFLQDISDAVGSTVAWPNDKILYV